jgi:hypothetical protein
MLWRRSLVMYDKETDTLWSHILGEAMSGELKGTQLKQVSSVMTTWGEWKAEHADGSVAMLKPTAKRFDTKYFRSLDKFVLGIADGGDAAAWSLVNLAKKPVVHDTWQETPIVVVYDIDSFTPRMYQRTLGGKQLTFRLVDRRLEDVETHSTWNLVTGRATAGPLKGKHLVAMPAIVSFKKAWRVFHEKSEYR